METENQTLVQREESRRLLDRHPQRAVATYRTRHV